MSFRPKFKKISFTKSNNTNEDIVGVQSNNDNKHKMQETEPKDISPRVYNNHHKNAPPSAIYIGRPSKWGNPFSHLPNTSANFKVSSRDEAIEKYREWLFKQPQLIEQAQRELKGKSLVCWCYPQKCHGDVLIEVANMKNKPTSKFKF